MHDKFLCGELGIGISDSDNVEYLFKFIKLASFTIRIHTFLHVKNERELSFKFWF